MEIKPLDFSKTHIYGSLASNYISEDDFFKPFITAFPNEKGYQKSIENRKFPKENREILHKVLLRQYEALGENKIHDNVKTNIDLLLKEQTYTITTGQQIHVFGGPLYVYAKIFSAIRKCRELKEKYPEGNFVPVFWMAGEDHDFEEINHVNLFGKKIEWNRPENFLGPVGKMPLDTIHEMTNQLKEMFKNDATGAEILNQFDEAYHQHADLETATFALFNQWFGEYGLLILNPNDAELKRLFLPVILKEIKENPSKEYVDKTSEKLQEKYSKQAQAKDINLFYINDKERNRIEIDNGMISIDGTEEKYTIEAFAKLVELHPENISPNVILRPVYQETILPDIAYIGGPGELAYWLQLKDNFGNFGIQFPLFDLRKSIVPVNQKSYDKALKIIDDLYFWFNDLKEITDRYVESKGVKDMLDNKEVVEIKAQFENLSVQLKQEIPTLETTLQIEKLKIEEALERLNAKYVKAQKQSYEQELKQIENIKNKFFNQKLLIERTESVLSNHFIIHKDFIENFINNKNISILNMVIF